MANTTAATVATTMISSTLGTLRGMITIATATARPSKKYLIARVINSVPENPSMSPYTPGHEIIFINQQGNFNMCVLI
jgi:hypothetical protein